MSLIHDSLQQLENRHQDGAGYRPATLAREPAGSGVPRLPVLSGLVLLTMLAGLGGWWLTQKQPAPVEQTADVSSPTAEAEPETVPEAAPEVTLAQGWPGQQQARVVGYRVPQITGPDTASVKAPAPVPPVQPQPLPQPVAVALPHTPTRESRAVPDPGRNAVGKRTDKVQSRMKVQQLMDDIRTHARQGQYEAARQSLDLLGQSVSENALTYRRMEAYLSARQGDVQAAIIGYERVLQQLPQDQEALGNISLLLLKAGNRERAEHYFAQLQRHHPGSSITRQLARHMEQRK